MIRIGLRLDPLGPLLFRDGRPFDAATRASGGLPTPRTLAGALRTALLGACPEFNFDTFRQKSKDGSSSVDALKNARAPEWLIQARFRGPWLARTISDPSSTVVEPLIPTPAVLVRGEVEGGGSAWARNHPRRDLPGWADRDRLPLWRTEVPEGAYPAGFLGLAGIRAFLEGGCPSDADHKRPDELFGFDDRTHVAIDTDRRTGADGQLFGTRRLVLNPGVAFYAEVLVGDSPELDEQFRGVAIPFGGEGGLVAVNRVALPVDWPSVEPAEGDGGAPARSIWLLATPAFVDPAAGQMPLPSGLANHPHAQVRAAASREPLAVSGWDVARNGPLPSRFAVPAGSTYFVESEKGHSNPPDSLCSEPEDAAQGWGFALRGVWTRS